MLPKRTKVEWLLIAVVIIATAARESGLIPDDPWGRFLGISIASLYTWGILQRPEPAR